MRISLRVAGGRGAAAFGALDESILYVCGVGLENMCVWLLDLAHTFIVRCVALLRLVAGLCFLWWFARWM